MDAIPTNKAQKGLRLGLGFRVRVRVSIRVKIKYQIASIGIASIRVVTRNP